MFLAVLFILAKNGGKTQKKKKNHPSEIHHQVNGLWYIHKKEHSVIKRNKQLIHATTWMNLKILILSEVTQKRIYIV